ncbi:hypothetical protein [Aureimonas sp. AU12]|uniref:hypothetical protein n=1 Tax=Aureimonas sp. AU12 TaxID=1638161 RepID=UPI000AB243DE|nr:hypothetical protein [Aureimonas sp. AU12]
MPSGVAASTRTSYWKMRDKDEKRYFHFDRKVSRKNLESLANSPDLVAKHSFYPLLSFKEEWIRYRGDGVGKKKSRPIRYASRKDAAIYARYRAILLPCYEEELSKREISDVPIAYRKIIGPSGAGKNNIDFAVDVFRFVQKAGNCVATVVDISSYFDSLDHGIIEKNWKLLMGGVLPADHNKVLKSLTNYVTVDSKKLFERLELYKKGEGASKVERRMRRIDRLRSLRHVQLLSPKDFRAKVCGGDPNLPSLLQKNPFKYGIPQGTPISDLIANFYLLDFDTVVSAWVSERSGIYRRYSDDIVVIVPIENVKSPHDVADCLKKEIINHGPKIKIQDKKVAVGIFTIISGQQSYKHCFGMASKNGLEYLGFEFNGLVVKIKDATLSNAWRRLKRRSYGFAKRYVRQYRQKGDDWISINYPSEMLEIKILKKVTAGQDVGFKSWTFIRYVRQASVKFIGFDRDFSHQIKRYRRMAGKLIKMDLNKALEKYGNNSER